jgi:hypothetical protein
MIHQSPFPALDIPATTIHRLILDSLAAGPERPVMTDAKTGVTVTNCQLGPPAGSRPAGLAPVTP